MRVGDYIRTKYGIRKIANIEKDEGYGKPKVKVLVFDRHIEDVRHFGYKFYTDEKIIKNSKFSENILSLIKVGDLINKKEVVKIIHFEGDTFYRIELFGGKAIMNVKDIKSIVTKEEIERMEYKIND